MGRALGTVLVLSALAAAVQGAPSSELVPAAAAAPRYVEARVCGSRHETEWNVWQGSHHDRSMEVPSEQSVLGDFGGATFEGAGLWARFSRDGEGYWVETRTGADPVERYRVRYTFGVSPLQQVLLELPGGRLSAFTVAWDTERRVWFHLQPDSEHVAC